MSKAVEKAYKAYPLTEDNHLNHEWNAKRVGFQQGYEQAEKDMELTWEDVREMCKQSVLVEVDLGGLVSDERHYTEVLKRFKERKENYSTKY